MPLKKYTFPWQKNNNFSLLVNGNIFFPRMLQTIESAQNYIFFEMYLFKSGKVATLFIDALCKAASRGVSIYLYLDDFGSKELNKTDKKRLKDSGILLTFFNPLQYGKLLLNLRRNHRKLLLVDGNIVFTGGTGISDEFSPLLHPSDFWRETMIEISGPVVADWQTSFLSVWKRKENIPPMQTISAAHESAFESDGRLAIIHPPYRSGVIRSLIKRMRRAKKRIWIETAYFIPSRKIRRELKKAALAGVDVRLILPGTKTDHPPIRRLSHNYYQTLLQKGVRIFEYEPSFMHSKVMLCDDWVSVGSSNLDKWSLRWNMEANQEVYNKEFAQTVIEMFNSDFKKSCEIPYDSWIKRSGYMRLLESFWMSVMVWSEYLIEMRKVHLSGITENKKSSLRKKSKRDRFNDSL